MDRRRAALYALVAFAVATAVAIVISGSRPAGEQGAAPLVVQGVGYVFAVLAARGTARSRRRTRRARTGSSAA